MSEIAGFENRETWLAYVWMDESNATLAIAKRCGSPESLKQWALTKHIIQGLTKKDVETVNWRQIYNKLHEVKKIKGGNVCQVFLMKLVKKLGIVKEK
jgi:hypothetical protein